jgi:hypothetical protein
VVDWDSSSEENFCGRFLVRDDEVRSDGGIWDVGGAGVGSFIADAEDETGYVVEECLVFGAKTGKVL